LIYILFKIVKRTYAGYKQPFIQSLINPRLNSIEQFFNQMKHYLKLYKSKDFDELKLNLKKSIKNIKEESYKNYFIYAYNKEHYKNKKKSSKKRTSSKHRTPKIYKT